ncbi:MAG: hypothetical protein ACRELB_02770 [Polyangiaceae bacterium]
MQSPPSDGEHHRWTERIAHALQSLRKASLRGVEESLAHAPVSPDDAGGSARQDRDHAT